MPTRPKIRFGRYLTVESVDGSTVYEVEYLAIPSQSPFGFSLVSLRRIATQAIARETTGIFDIACKKLVIGNQQRS